MDAELKEMIIYSMIEGAEPFGEALTWAVNYLEVAKPRFINTKDLQSIEKAVFDNMAANYQGAELIEELERRRID